MLKPALLSIGEIGIELVQPGTSVHLEFQSSESREKGKLKVLKDDTGLLSEGVGAIFNVKRFKAVFV